jgi:Fe-S cluster assembly iron-binding protein IscA
MPEHHFVTCEFKRPRPDPDRRSSPHQHVPDLARGSGSNEGGRTMLTLTPTAAEAVRALVTNMEVDDSSGGLRISSGEAAAQNESLTLAVVNGPEPMDDEIAAAGANVFLEPAVSAMIDNKVLDATMEGDQVRFMLFDRGARDASDGSGPPA